MQIKADGQNYAPKGRASAVCAPGEFPVGIIGLDHGHIFGMSNGLSEAGAHLAMVYDPDPEKVAAYCAQYEGVRAARCKEEILEKDVYKRQVYELRTTTNQAQTGTIGKALEFFCKTVEEKSGGRIKTTANFGSELGSQSEQVEMCQACLLYTS